MDGHRDYRALLVSFPTDCSEAVPLLQSLILCASVIICVELFCYYFILISPSFGASGSYASCLWHIHGIFTYMFTCNSKRRLCSLQDYLRTAYLFSDATGNNHLGVGQPNYISILSVLS